MSKVLHLQTLSLDSKYNVFPLLTKSQVEGINNPKTIDLAFKTYVGD